MKFTNEWQPDCRARRAAVNRENVGGGLASAASSPPTSSDGCPAPAAGYRNGDTLNNEGSNGNYWSATPNSGNANNAYNLNFNSSNFDWNNNNRHNGFAVRPVSA